MVASNHQGPFSSSPTIAAHAEKISSQPMANPDQGMAANDHRPISQKGANRHQNAPEVSQRAVNRWRSSTTTRHEARIIAAKTPRAGRPLFVSPAHSHAAAAATNAKTFAASATGRKNRTERRPAAKSSAVITRALSARVIKSCDHAVL